MEKDFENWHTLKSKINRKNNLPTFKEREVWWASIGLNVGHETDGKGKNFNRPILVVKKFNNQLCWGVPLTTKIKNTPHYYQFSLDGSREQCAMLTHLRLWDVKRLTHKIGRLAEKEFQVIRHKLRVYIA